MQVEEGARGLQRTQERGRIKEREALTLLCEKNEGGQRKMGDCSWYNTMLIITYVEMAQLKPERTPWLCDYV